LADEKLSDYSRSPLLGGAVLHLVYESTPYNKQLQRTVIPQHVRAASASFHYALAARITRRRAAAELRRYTARMAYRSGKFVFPCDPESTFSSQVDSGLSS
jgi:hypothetical protein